MISAYLRAMKKLEHVGIAVANLEEAEKTFTDVLGSPSYKRETVDREGVITSFFQAGESKIELLAATREDSPIAKFLEKRGPGIHHLAFNVSDLKNEIATLESKGYRLISNEPKKGADGKLIVFLHPKSTNGVLVELCQNQ